MLAVLAALAGLTVVGTETGAAVPGLPADAVDVADQVDATSGPDEISAIRVAGGRLEVLQATVSDGEEALAFAGAAADGGELIAVEVDVELRPDADIHRALQWNLDLVRFEKANTWADGSGVTVAVLDSSIAAGHRELAGRLLPGWDFVDDGPWRPSDPGRQVGDGSHGTHVAGIIAAISGNGHGIHGASPGAMIMPVRVITSRGGVSSDVAAGVIWAVDHGADVVNLSLSGDDESALVRAAIDYAASEGVVVVASAGNSGDRDSPPAYPAVHDSVIAVGAVAEDGRLWVASNRGEYLDVVAPGVEIVSLRGEDGTYGRMTGTSQAAPHVSALAAMILSVAPSLTPAQVQAAVEDTATDRGPVGFDTGYGHGVIDAAEAVAAAAPGTPAPPSRVWAADLGADGLRIRWEHADNSRQGYEVLRDGRVIASLPRTASGYDIGRPDLTTGPLFQVRSTGLRGSRSGPIGLMPAPASLAATAAVGSVELSWPGVPAASGYLVYRDGGALTTVAAGAGRAVTYVDRAVTAGRAYRYQVAALEPNGLPGVRSTAAAATPRHAPTAGYLIVTNLGRVLAYGDATNIGDGTPSGDVIAGAASPSGDGYWLAHADGAVEAFGDAVWLGDVSHLPLEAPIVAMAAQPSGGGYWLLAADGGVFTFGAAQFFGSTGGLPLEAPVVDLAVTPTGLGYWFVAADGGVFTFGDAVFKGSTGGWALDAPVVSMAAGPGGYWLIAEDGGVFTFGPQFHGSLPGTLAHVPPDQRPAIVRMRPVNAGQGYLLLADDGGIFGYGRQSSFGSAHGSLPEGGHVVDLIIS